MKKIDKLFENFNFNEKTESDIKEVNGIKLPQEYLDFMKIHNGGEGSIGENGYLVLWKIEELKELNDDYEASDWPNCILLGTDGGDELIAYNQKENVYCEIDSCNIEDDTYINKCSDFEEFISTIANF